MITLSTVSRMLLDTMSGHLSHAIYSLSWHHQSQVDARSHLQGSPSANDIIDSDRISLRLYSTSIAATSCSVKSLAPVDLKDFEQVQQRAVVGRDAMVGDLSDDEGFADHDDNDIFVLCMVALVMSEFFIFYFKPTIYNAVVGRKSAATYYVMSEFEFNVKCYLLRNV